MFPHGSDFVVDSSLLHVVIYHVWTGNLTYLVRFSLATMPWGNVENSAQDLPNQVSA